MFSAMPITRKSPMRFNTSARGPLGMNGYQWVVLAAAWLGWGFDVFDGLLFNYVAPNCVPTLLHLGIGSLEAKRATLLWTGILTSTLLLGWAAGGIIFGSLADRIGRARTLMLTMTLYAVGTACCAFAPNIGILLLFRLVAALGIGGEWAAGAAMVAEVVPEKRRVEAGALLYTSAPFGLFLATFVNQQIAGGVLASRPDISWRYVFLCGLIPAFVAVLFRVFVREPERWQASAKTTAPARIAELFQPGALRLTISGLIPALTVLIMWWSCNAFTPVVAKDLALSTGHPKLAQSWITLATTCFNWGGLIGTLLTIPAAKYLGRRPMFALYFLLSSAALFTTFGLHLPPHTRLYLYFFVGLTVFGVFGSFTYYLPELFPTRLRGTGAGFCYNTGRIIASAGPFLVGYLASQGVNALQTTLHILFTLGYVPLIGLCFLPWVIETKGQALPD